MARRFAGRRKPRVAWLPVFGDAQDPLDEKSIGIRFALTLSSGIEVDAVPLTWDGSRSSEAEQIAGGDFDSLADFVNGNAYRLRRIVGKFFCSFGTIGTSNVQCAQVAAGLIVCRTDSNGNVVTDLNTTNPLAQDSADDPWIWRRTWLLSHPGYDYNVPFARFPATNTAYGSVADGPHIDQKTARVIGPDERLVAMFAARALQTTGAAAPTATVISGYLDYRLLGSMRTNVGNRRNASR